VIYGIFRLYGYRHRKRTAFWSNAPGKFLPSLCIRKCGAILAPVAYYPGHMAEDLCGLSFVGIPNGTKMEPVWKKTSGKIFYPSWRNSAVPVPCVALQWPVAWGKLELYFLWHVLFCHTAGRQRSGTGP